MEDWLAECDDMETLKLEFWIEQNELNRMRRGIGSIDPDVRPAAFKLVNRMIAFRQNNIEEIRIRIQQVKDAQS